MNGGYPCEMQTFNNEIYIVLRNRYIAQSLILQGKPLLKLISKKSILHLMFSETANSSTVMAGNSFPFQVRDESPLSCHVPANATRRSYLITLAQADKEIFPTRKSFAKCIVEAFDKAPGLVHVRQWVCAIEQHQTEGEHYHMAVLLSGPRRWKTIKASVYASHGVVVHFSDKHDNYDWAYKYVCKVDKFPEQSRNHRDMNDADDVLNRSKTNKCIRAYRESAQKRKSMETPTAGKVTESKRKRLTDADVAKFIVEKDIKTEKELKAAAKARDRDGMDSLYSFCVSRDAKKLSLLIANAWEMESAEEDVQRSKLTRMEILDMKYKGDCVEDCNGRWYDMAVEILTLNKIFPPSFGYAVKQLLQKGRGKFRNVMIVGQTNSAKSFILTPLEVLFKTFSNPAKDKFAWMGVEEAECIFLNDFRWSSEMIAWSTFLLLLEGATVHLPAPKNVYAKDIKIDRDIPIFATCGEELEYRTKFNQIDQTETDMMRSRWKVFHFNYQIPVDEQIEVKPCGKCFARLVLDDFM